MSVKFKRCFTKENEDVLDGVRWKNFDVIIKDNKGNPVFEQKSVEFPKFYSQQAVNIITNKYFRGIIGTKNRETRYRDLISRVVNTNVSWGENQGYFKDENEKETYKQELTHILVYQKSYFNSPVWFNMGFPGREQAASACFINSIDDTLESIMETTALESRIFQQGSGSGLNMSSLRSRFEDLSTGGTSSGVLSFMKVLDINAGVTKCITGESLIRTDNGIVCIEDLFNVKNNFGFNKVNGVKIQTSKGMLDVSKIFLNKPDNIHNVELKNTGLSIRGTSEHPLLVLNSDLRYEWKKIPQIKEGEKIAVYRGISTWPDKLPELPEIKIKTNIIKKDINIPKKMTKELARFLGYMVSEGCISNNKKNKSFRFCNSDLDTFNDFIECVKKVFNVKKINISERMNPKTKVITYSFSAHWHHVVSFLNEIGLDDSLSRLKEVPWIILQSPKDIVIEFLKAYFDGDGHCSSHVFCSSASEVLTNQIQNILLNFGIISQKKSECVNEKRYYRLRMTGKDACSFMNEIGFNCVRKLNMFNIDKNTKFNTNIDTIPYVYKHIRKLSPGKNGWFKDELGKPIKIKIYPGKGGHRVNQSVSYSRLKEDAGWIDRINIVSSELSGKMRKIISDNFFWDEVKSNNLEKEKEVTYDVHVDDVHEFIANGIVNHNSGGATRRAAKMVILNIEHPEIVDFINCKVKEEEKAYALIREGYDPSYNGEAYSTISFQNANNSIRVTDDFMERALGGKDFWTKLIKSGKRYKKYNANDILTLIAEATWKSGDPGVQFHDTINYWNTCKEKECIASNPCVTGDTLISLDSGLSRIKDIVGGNPSIINGMNDVSIAKKVVKTGVKDVYLVTTKSGYSLKCTSDHKILTKKGDKEATQLKQGDFIKLGKVNFGNNDLNKDIALCLGLLVGDGCLSRDGYISLTMSKIEERKIVEKYNDIINNMKKCLCADYNKKIYQSKAIDNKTSCKSVTRSTEVVSFINKFIEIDNRSENKKLKDFVFSLNGKSISFILKGLFTADGTVECDCKKNNHIALDSTSLSLLKQVQILLLGFGIKSKIYKNRNNELTKLLPDSNRELKEYNVKQMHSLRITRSSRILYEKYIGFDKFSKKNDALKKMNKKVKTYQDDIEYDAFKTIEYIGKEDVYDITEPITEHFIANGIVVHNCSEYVAQNDTSCNLASVNLLSFLIDGEFNVEEFVHTCWITSVAQDIWIDGAKYPSEKIEEGTKKYRTIGLGYTNLGALLMASGLPYDSDESRDLASAITSLMTATAYERSMEFCSILPTFSQWEVGNNKKTMMEVIEMHSDKTSDIKHNKFNRRILQLANKKWNKIVKEGENTGFRNSYVTNLAPTGTISFAMDCDTTGCEPSMALITYKLLAGSDSTIDIVNNTAVTALYNLGYEKDHINKIREYILAHNTVAGCEGVNEKHFSIFDTAMGDSDRSISYMGHLKMLEAIQPFISGGISKTINMSKNATVEDVMEAYISAWKMGIKCVAIYRDGSKGSQPITTVKEKRSRATRVRLPDDVDSKRHKFSINGQDVILQCGLYPDGTLGEIFITSAQQGSTMRGMLDTWAITFSVSLQYGVPLKVLISKFLNTQFEPHGFTGKKDIIFCSSIVDYVVRYLALRFLSEKEIINLGISINGSLTKVSSVENTNKNDNDQDENIVSGGSMCPICGGMMRPNGNCKVCITCGGTTGCS